jgi:uncharacterized protein (DUF1800 family)
MNNTAYRHRFSAVIIGAALGCAAMSHAQVRSTPSPDYNATIDAARLLTQASFGATRAEIDRVAALGPAAWINEQFAKPQVSHVTTTQDFFNNRQFEFYELMSPSVWKQFIEGDDQLRQRVAFALSQIMVVSLRNNVLLDNACGPASYMDLLGKHAFGNFRDLMKDVTLNAAMGEYLDMKKSGKVTTVNNPDGSAVAFTPNENYARELLQLFTIGTDELNLDGSVKKDGTGKPIPTYDESVVKGVAKAFTGWTFGADRANDPDFDKPWRWLYTFYPDSRQVPNQTTLRDIQCKLWSRPMEPWTSNREQPGKYDFCDAELAAGRTPNYNTCTKPDLPPPHDTGAKKLLNGVTLPAGQTPMQDMDATIDNIFNHPNVGPFIARQLIQRLTASNPSGEYVKVVAKVFNNNGSGVRGDMKSVIRAILLANEVRLEARTEDKYSGKLKEPVVRWVQYARAFNAKTVGGDYRFYDLGTPDSLGQDPLRAPSVFNYYSPSYLLSGQPVGTMVTAPEFEITTTNSVAGWASFSNWGVIDGLFNNTTGADAAKHLKPDYSAYLPLAQNNPAKLIDELTLLLLSGKIEPDFRAKLIQAVERLPLDANTPPMERLHMALWLIINSPEYMIQK